MAALDTRPLVMGDLNGPQKRAARAIVRDYGANLPDEMEAQGASKRRQAANARAKGGKPAQNARTYDAAAARMEQSAPVIRKMKRRPTTVQGMAANNVEAVKLAATTQRMPGESLGGTGWYVHANEAVQSEVPHGFPLDRAIAASSTLSQGTRPEDERASMGAAAHAIHSGAGVTMTPHVRAHLVSRGLPVTHAPGTVVPFHELSGAHASALAAPEIREHMEAHSPQIGWRELGRAASEGNRAKAHEILTGRTPVEEAQSPFTAPKTNTYTRNIAMATRGDAANEYLARGAHLGDLIRGDVSKGQEMLDLYGKRHSEEGILSPHLTTPQDSWQMGIHNVGVSEPSVTKVSGDMAPGVKTHQGVSAAPDARITSQNVVHAVHDEATQKAAAMLTSEYRPGYRVPSQLVQETGWTGARRLAGEDSEFNAQQREQGRISKEAAVTASELARPKKTTRPVINGQQFKAVQGELF